MLKYSVFFFYLAIKRSVFCNTRKETIHLILKSTYVLLCLMYKIRCSLNRLIRLILIGFFFSISFAERRFHHLRHHHNHHHHHDIGDHKGSFIGIYNCQRCGRSYKTKYTCRRHERLECGLPAQYSCSLCSYRAKHKHSVKQHFDCVHKKKSPFIDYLKNIST